MGDIADLHSDFGSHNEFDDYNNKKILTTLDTQSLMEITCIYLDEGYINVNEFAYKMVEFYNANGYLTDKQRASTVKALCGLPPLNEIEAIIDKAEKYTLVTPIQEDKNVRIAKSMDEYKRYTAIKKEVALTFSNGEDLTPYDLDYLELKWFGRVKKTYYQNQVVQIRVGYNPDYTYMAVDTAENKGYICQSYDIAFKVKQALEIEF